MNLLKLVKQRNHDTQKYLAYNRSYGKVVNIQDNGEITVELFVSLKKLQYGQRFVVYRVIEQTNAEKKHIARLPVAIAEASEEQNGSRCIIMRIKRLMNLNGKQVIVEAGDQLVPV